MAVTERRRNSPAPPRWFNRTVLAVLRSPLHPLLDPGICELRYRGRRSGRSIALPVIFARDGARIVVLVGDAARKRWWRGFVTPYPVEVRRHGRPPLAGTGRILAPDEPDYPRAARAYRARQHVAVEPGDRLLLIENSENGGARS